MGDKRPQAPSHSVQSSEEQQAPSKRHRVAEAPGKWDDLPAEKLTFCIGTKDASTAVGLINSAARCPALTAYDLRWRRHSGQRPQASGWLVQLLRSLLDNANDPPMPIWPALSVELTEPQRRSLRWMLTKEAGTDDELVVERGCQDCRFSTHRGIDFQVRFSFTLRGGILADSMGYGKTLLAVALTAASCGEALPERKGKPPCSPTLIFVPENLVYQWLREFKKAFGEAVHVRLFGRHNSPAVSSSRRSGSAGPELSIGTPGEAETSSSSTATFSVYAAASAEGWAELMLEANWSDALALVMPYSLLRSVEPWFCLHRFHWRRIIIDELHEALSCQTMADALALISSQHVWGLSGTLPTATAGDVVRLAALFGVSLPIDETNAGRFLDCYVRRNNSSVADNIPVDQHCQVVRPNPMERAIYLACQHDFDLPLEAPEAHAGYVPAFLSTWRGLQEHGREAALVKLCCHHQVTTTDVELLSTPAQSVERLRIWKKHHCEEAKRLIQKNALLAEWMQRNAQRSPGHLTAKRPVTSTSCASIGDSDRDAQDLAEAEVAKAVAMTDEQLLEACGKDLGVTAFALCDRPNEAEARWLEWCEKSGLCPGTKGAISRLRKIMYDELWGRLVDGADGWAALSKMSGRDWQADYAAAQQSRLHEAVADFGSSLRSARFLESAVRQASSAPGEVECGICLQEMRFPCITPCAHIFCAVCIERSLVSKPECPQCRAPVQGRSQLSALQSSIPSSPSSNFVQAGSHDGFFGSKITALVAKLEAIQRSGEKAVVFAQWQDLIFKIHAALSQYGVPAAVLAGGAFERASVLQQFESPTLPVLLLSLED
ncbi:unnamed protein product, partial [Polarella glacialis]